MSAVGKRRSPRLSKSPPPKRKKLERTETVEVEDELELKRKVIERKTTSFLEEMNKDVAIAGVVASLSFSNQKKLMKSLSSIINPLETTDEPKPVVISRIEGIDDRYTFTKQCNDKGPCWLELPFDFLIQLISLLPAQEAWKFGQLCHYTMTLLTSFSSHVNLPMGARSNKATTSVNIPGFTISLYNGYTMKSSEVRNSLSQFCAKPNMHWNRPERGLLVQRGCVSQPEGLSLQLYDYQGKGLTWMLAIERIAKKKQPIVFSSLLSVPGHRGQVIDAKDMNSVPFHATKDCYTQEKYQCSFEVQGGVFADEMGLGKTISMIALILSNPRVPKLDGTFSPCNTGKDEPPAAFQSKATLLICPGSLVNQWASEIEKHTSLLCYKVATAAQHKKLRYSMVIKADVIIVSAKFLKSNPTYKDLWREQNNLDKESKKRTTEPTKRSSRTGTEKVSAPLSGLPLFHVVAWHRIIMDEAHDIVLEVDLSYFVSNYRWYVTGTPFPDKKRFSGAMNLIGRNIAPELLESCMLITDIRHSYAKINNLLAFLWMRAAKNSIFWRNTKLSVDSQIEIPPVTERIQMVYLSPIEQAIYDTNSEWGACVARRIISNPNLHFELKLNDPKITQKYVEKYNKQIERERTHIASLTDVREVKRYEKRIMKSICERAHFARLFSESEEKCDNCCEVSLSFVNTSCHKLCIPCINEMVVAEEMACIKCNTPFDMSLVRATDEGENFPDLDNEKLFAVPDSDDITNELRRYHGSKMAAILGFITKIMQESDAKMIVFSQYQDSLNHLTSILEELDPLLFQDAIVQLKGNLHVRKKRLDRFNSTGPDAARIVIMDLKTSAAGTHLAAASYVLLLDPVIGHKGDVEATDAQAIARAHRLGQSEPVKVVRFIVARTIDQTDYENAYGAIVPQRRGLGPKSARK